MEIVNEDSASSAEDAVLPPLPESVPQYYRDIVDLCRAEDPIDRAPAWRLLEMFPPLDEAEEAAREPERAKAFDIDAVKRAFRVQLGCEHCQGPIDSSLFLCNTCHRGGFYMCRACYEEGRHCYEREHLLVELDRGRFQDWTHAGRYHSVAGDDGERRIINI